MGVALQSENLFDKLEYKLPTAAASVLTEHILVPI